MINDLSSLKSIYKEYEENLQALKSYIEFNKENESAHYNQFRSIVYGAIINRAYSLWETFSKELFFKYYSLRKKDFIKDKTFISRYKIHELPAYLLEKANYDELNETMSLALSKEILVFTGKNVELNELNKLYNKIDIPINRYIEKSDYIKSFLEEKELPLESAETKEDNKIARSLKFIIKERNKTAHDASIDEYQDMNILEDWIEFFGKLGFVLYESVILYYTNELIHINRVVIGECKTVINSKIGCFDIEENVVVECNNLVFVYKGIDLKESLVDILIAESFKVEDEDKDKVESFDKAGIVFKSFLYTEPKIKDNYKYFILPSH
ncbi:hypothetical protein C3496_10460 [Bacillus anthracis]|uniref:HEPN domain-containing protein n=1 Tax=Bacillus TaxID=1386 RepID=UPI0010A5F3FA|nr:MULTISPECIES: HEPN domain-containing protein [Bacillus]QBJ66773.1 hypothetical protein C3496_10460 [Bacillus anthracis]THG62949.1 hypothetical protein E7Y01_04165 [Bacillus sp. HUB-I-004]